MRIINIDSLSKEISNEFIMKISQCINNIPLRWVRAKPKDLMKGDHIYLDDDNPSVITKVYDNYDHDPGHIEIRDEYGELKEYYLDTDSYYVIRAHDSYIFDSSALRTIILQGKSFWYYSSKDSDDLMIRKQIPLNVTASHYTSLENKKEYCEEGLRKRNNRKM